MGNLCGGGYSDTPESRKIDAELKEWRRILQDETRVLLLGTAESGKSTIFKQLKILSAKGFTPDEVQHYKRIVIGNYISQMKLLIVGVSKSGLRYESSEHRDFAVSLSAVDANNPVASTTELSQLISELWRDRAIQAVYHDHKLHNVQLDDSAQYLFDNVDRFLKLDYVPNDKDILHCRSRTTGIDECCFNFEELEFRLIDVGGQRAERRKWIHSFDGVTAVWFVVSLSDYDQVLREDPAQNRMKEALLLFDEISNSPWFRNVDMIVFFNKTDTFSQKFPISPLNVCFPDFPSSRTDITVAQQYIAERFLALNRSPHHLYHHFTCAIDSDIMMPVFQAVRKTLLGIVLTHAGVNAQ